VRSGRADRRPAGDPDHLPVPARRLEHAGDRLSLPVSIIATFFFMGSSA
jgi:hypothetical protein